MDYSAKYLLYKPGIYLKQNNYTMKKDFVSELSIGEKAKEIWKPSSPVKYILPNSKTRHLFIDICKKCFHRSNSFVSVFKCFIAFEFTLLLVLVSFPLSFFKY